MGRNRSFLEHETHIDAMVPQAVEDCLFDPQTSGGLLISVTKEKATMLLDALKDCPTEYAVIGEVIAYDSDYRIFVTK